jgi:transposase
VVAHLVTRFNQQGMVAIVPGHGGGPPPTYTVGERDRILAAARRAPDREADGTATWSLMTLRRALRSAPDGLPNVSTGTIRTVLIEAGWSWQRSRSWCETGTAQRKRKGGSVTVVDPDAEAKKS